MDIYFYVNHSEKIKIGKNLTNEFKLTGTLRNESNVVNPEILIELDNPSIYNYARIDAFGRYYFIQEITSIRNNLWMISMKSDPLESFKNEILSNPVILSDSEVAGAEKYLSGDVWKTKVKDSTDIINFPNGLLNSGEFILITAGG